ncbi:MAG TPA: hydantoinase/oxoprolinase family protein, partial [Usitatibacteraceae bacterium]|nr:hydantoinase/oxoprolinase family protein [Usitatibacteraceae bacterium]
FGGAGGQHACLVADELGMTQVFIHPLAGVLSAYGMGLARVRALREEAVEKRLEEAGPDLEAAAARLAALCTAELEAQGEIVERIERRAHLKYEGTD